MFKYMKLYKAPRYIDFVSLCIKPAQINNSKTTIHQIKADYDTHFHIRISSYLLQATLRLVFFAVGKTIMVINNNKYSVQ